jgi:hypothetical protein
MSVARALLLLLLATAVHADVFVVTSDQDTDTNGTLRWAIGQANALPGPDEVTAT